MKTLITFISRQIMPQALVAIECKPSAAILLHTDHPQESLIPARNLKRLFVSKGWIEENKVQLIQIPHDNYSAIVHSLERLDLTAIKNPLLNLTGGNKLMSLAGFFWASRHGIPAVYLERGNKLTRFEPGSKTGGLQACEPCAVPEDLGREAEALDLLKTQLIHSEIATTGERLQLHSKYHAESNESFADKILRDSHPENYLSRTGEPHHRPQSGDILEYRTAAILLKIGVETVWRGVSLKNPKSGKKQHSEVDLIFQHGSTLWLVDCKDQKGSDQMNEDLDRLFENRNITLNHHEQQLVDRIKNQLQMKELKFLKEDLVLARELGGLRGEIVCVRKSQLTEEAAEFANNNQIKVAYTSTLFRNLQQYLFPDQPASEDAIQGLMNHFGK